MKPVNNICKSWSNIKKKKKFIHVHDAGLGFDQSGIRDLSLFSEKIFTTIGSEIHIRNWMCKSWGDCFFQWVTMLEEIYWNHGLIFFSMTMYIWTHFVCTFHPMVREAHIKQWVLWLNYHNPLFIFSPCLKEVLEFINLNVLT